MVVATVRAWSPTTIVKGIQKITILNIGRDDKITHFSLTRGKTLASMSELVNEFFTPISLLSCADLAIKREENNYEDNYGCFHSYNFFLDFNFIHFLQNMTYADSTFEHVSLYNGHATVAVINRKNETSDYQLGDLFSHCGLFQKYENDTWVQFGDKNGPCVEFLHFQLMTVHTSFMDFIYVFFQKPPKKVIFFKNILLAHCQRATFTHPRAKSTRPWAEMRRL